MRRQLTSAFFILVLLLLTVPVWPATPPSGTISQVGQSLAWSGGPFTAASLSPGTCVEPVSCDTFTLTLNIPADKVGQVFFRINWADATNDLDLFVFDAEGNQLDASTSGDQNFEEVRLTTLRAGNYRVLTNAFLSVNTVYSGSLTLDAITDPPVEPEPDLSSKIIFGDNTLVDFSATSGEPFIKTDLKDNIFVSVPFGFSTTVSLLWKSIDRGRTFIPLGSPIVRDAVTAPGGGDTHQDFDANNFLYYVDLSAACVTAAVSTDEGNTFPPDRTNSLVCVSEENPNAAGDDRQWVAAFGSGIAYATWRNLLAGSFWIFKTTDGGRSWDKGTLMGSVSQSGPLQIDKTKRSVVVEGVNRNAILTYQIFYRGTELRVFRVTDLDDGSPVKIDDLPIVNPGASVGNVFPILTLDREGNLYAVWSQSATEVYMATSTNRGATWSKPVLVSNLTGTNIMPWAVAGDPGRINIVWYRSPIKGNPDVDESTWEIFMAQSTNALKSKPSFQLAKVNQNIIHRGEICLQGLGCDISIPMRDRSFLEFPSVTIDSNGAAIVTFNDNTNQVEGAYVMVAKQINGPSLFKSQGNLKAAHVGPKTTDNDESGDARFPDHGAVIGTNIPAMDIRSVSLSDDPQAIIVSMEVADLTPLALTTAAEQSGGDGLLYLVQWDFNDDIYWVAAEVRGGAPVFHTGTLGLIKSATSKKFITYRTDPVKSLEVQGVVSSTPLGPGKITFRIPRSIVGNPPKGATFYSATGYSMSERGPMLPVGDENVPNPTALPLKVDASGALHYVVSSEQP